MRLALLALMMAPLASADEWPSPVVREVFSSSRDWFVRVTPGKSIGDTVGFSGGPKGHYATAEFYRREPDRSYRLASNATLFNPVAPYEFYVTDGGFLITLDNWHNLGYGKVVAFYSNEGKPIRAYELSDLFNKDEIEKFLHSVSSIHWHTASGSYIRPGGNTFFITIDEKGASFVFELTGAYQYCETRSGKFQCRTTNDHRQWGAFREPAVPAANR